MKFINIYRSLLMLVIIASFAFACNDKDENLKGFTVTEGAMINQDKSKGTFDASGVSFSFGVSTNDGFPVASVSLYKKLVTGAGTSDEVKVGDFTSLPATASFTSTQLLADVPVAGNVLSEANLASGDKWVFRYEINMTDGRTLSDGSTYELVVE